MIPYADLVTALERWRARNGLPVGGGGTVAAASTGQTGRTPMPSSGGTGVTPAPQARTAPPSAAPGPRSTMFGAAPAPVAQVATKVPTRPQTDEPVGLDDADVLEEGMFDNEGGDFAMSFGGGNPPLYREEGEGHDEATSIGDTPGGEAAPLAPFPEGGGDSAGHTHDVGYDDELLDEPVVPDPRRRS